MRTHVRFTAPSFSGARALAAWLSADLRQRGIVVAEPLAEDWGSLVAAEHAGTRLRIACGNAVVEEPDGTLVDSRSEWLVWVEPAPTGVLARLRSRRPDPTAALREVIHLVDACLRASPGVTGIAWHRVDARLQEHDHAATPE